MKRFAVLAAACLGMLVAPAAQASTVLFVLDASGSMWGQIDGEPKIDIARRVLGDLIADLPSDVVIGLEAYGHNRKDDCSDIEMLAPLGSDRASLKDAIEGLSPKGMTPLTESIKAAAAELREVEGASSIVVVSDGKETCNADPCAAAKAVRAAGTDLRIHVVGFDVTEEEGKQLACIAEGGGGKYFSASNAAELVTAFAQVKEVVAAPDPEPAAEPEPAAPKGPEVVFRDDFDGEELGDEWEVLNPNPDSYLVENGVLMILTSGNAPLAGSDELENVFRLTKSIPNDDWTATMRLLPEVATFREHYMFALYKDKDNMLSATTGGYLVCCGGDVSVQLRGQKVIKGEISEFSTRVQVSPHLGEFPADIGKFTSWADANMQAILMRIEKSGRNYTVSARIEGEATMKDGQEPPWVKVQKLTSLRSPGDSLVMALTQFPFNHPSYQVNGGEALVHIDWIKIEVPASSDE